MHSVEALERLALKDPDKRVRRGSAWALSELAWHIRHLGKGGYGYDYGSTPFSKEQTLSQGLEGFPEDGALRFLAETAMNGAWPGGIGRIGHRHATTTRSRDDEEEENTYNGDPVVSESEKRPHPLSALHAAAVLDCLAAAPRLPALDWTAICRRLLRSHPCDEHVHIGCVELVSAHSHVSSAYQLYEFVREDMLTPSRLRSMWCPQAQARLLRQLPELLAALPQDEARAVLTPLCEESALEGALGTTTCIVHSVGVWEQQQTRKNSSEKKAAGHIVLQRQAALAHGLARLTQGADHATDGASINDLGSDGRRAALRVLLPKVAKPGMWDIIQLRDPTTELIELGFGDHPPDETLSYRSEDALELSRRELWAALFRAAFLNASPEEVTATCNDVDFCNTHPVHFSWLTASLVASGRADVRALQHCRNAVLNGKLVATPDDEEVVTMLMSWALHASAQSHSGDSGIDATQQAQHAWLSDILGGVDKCRNPSGAVRLAACGVVGIASALDRNAGVTASALRSMVNCENALLSLPGSMSRLAEGPSPPWGLLCSLVAALPGVVGGGCRSGAARLCGMACLLICGMICTRNFNDDAVRVKMCLLRSEWGKKTCVNQADRLESDFISCAAWSGFKCIPACAQYLTRGM